jgi:hypothetical protein
MIGARQLVRRRGFGAPKFGRLRPEGPLSGPLPRHYDPRAEPEIALRQCIVARRKSRIDHLR